MARIKLNIPEGTGFTVVIPVRITDINYGNHLGNDSMVSILHEARVLWLKAMGYVELDIEGAGLIMSDLAVEYKKEAYYGDELSITMLANEFTSISFDLYYMVLNQKGTIVAKAKTGMVFYDYNKKKITDMPAAFRQKTQQIR